MLKENLTFNDLPEVVGKLCERIESLENALKDNLAKQAPAKENLHVPNIASELKIIPHIKICKIGEKAIQGGVPFCFPPCAAGRLFCLVLLLFDTRAAGSAAVEIYAVFVEYAPY